MPAPQGEKQNEQAAPHYRQYDGRSFLRRHQSFHPPS